jgi:hypothetical protein
MFSDGDLDKLFAEYREACPEVELNPNFMPEVWRRIETRRAFWPAFEHLARIAVAVCMFACLVFAVLDVAGLRYSAISDQSYAEALANDQSSEANFYAQAVPPSANVPEGAR